MWNRCSSRHRAVWDRRRAVRETAAMAPLIPFPVVPDAMRPDLRREAAR